MKIVQLMAENIKKLKAIEITPTDNLVMITGDNAQGKSSVLDCITYALCGGKEIPEKPIKKGKDKGKIIMDMGEFIITRSFTKDNSYLKIEPKNGSQIKSPQKFLDELVGKISFDPLEFLNNESKKQKDILFGLLGIDVGEIDAREKRLREERIILGRDRDRVKVLHDKAEVFPDDLPEKEVSINSLSTRLKEVMEWNSKLQAEIADNENLKALAKKDLERIALFREEAEELMKKARTITQKAGRLQKSVDEKKEEYVHTRDRLANTKVEDAFCIEKQMAEVEVTNTQIRGKREWLKICDEFQKLEKSYTSYSQQISDIATERSEALSGKEMPVEGLSFDDGGLLYNGIPLDQASDGEKLMISMGISMALNPQIRVLRIKDGSLLGPKNIAILSDMIKERDFQLFFEKVDTSGNIGIYIEEGEITKVDGKPVNTLPKSNAITITAQASQDGSASSIGAEDDWPAIKTPEAKPEDEGW